MSKKMAMHEIGQINYWPNSGKFYIISYKLCSRSQTASVVCIAGVDVFLFVCFRGDNTSAFCNMFHNFHERRESL